MHQFDNQHAERAAVASILQHPDFLTELSEQLELSAFKNPANRAIVELSIDLYNNGFTKFDRELLRNRITLIPVSGIENYQMQNYIEALLTADVEAVNFNNYLTELKEYHLRDSLNKLLNRSIAELPEASSAASLLGQLQTDLYDLDANVNRNDEPVDIGKSVRETIYGLVDNPLTGIPTGISLLDEMTLGWIPKKFYFIGARPGEGKSAFLLQSAVHATYFAPRDKRTRVLYLDTEIDDKEFKIRLIGHLAGVDTKIIQQGLFVKDENMKANVDKAIYFVEKIGGIYHKEMPGYSLSNVVNTIRKYVYSFGVGLVIFDYIEEPSDDGEKSRWEKVGLVARTLKKYAQILGIPIVAALQQNREGADKSRVSARMYAESDDVFKKADGAMALNIKSAEEIRKETLQAGTHRLQILKGRYHGTSYTGLNLKYVGYCLRFWPAKLQAMDQHENEQDNEPRNEQSQIPTAIDHPTGSLVP